MLAPPRSPPLKAVAMSERGQSHCPQCEEAAAIGAAADTAAAPSQQTLRANMRLMRQRTLQRRLRDNSSTVTVSHRSATRSGGLFRSTNSSSCSSSSRGRGQAPNSNSNSKASTPLSAAAALFKGG